MSSVIRKAMKTIKYIWIQAANCHTAHLRRPPKGVLWASWILPITALHCSLPSCYLSIPSPSRYSSSVPLHLASQVHLFQCHKASRWVMKGIKSRTGSGDFVPLVVWSFRHMCLPQGFCVSVSNFQKSKWLLVHPWFLAFSGLLMRAAWIPCYTGLTQSTTADKEQFFKTYDDAH